MAGDILGSAASGAAAGSVVPGLGTAIGAVGGALIGAAGSYFSSKSSADYAERSYKHRYRWMVNDLQKAGLNPMLAVGQSPGSPPQPSYQNVGEGAVKGMAAGVSAKMALAQIEQIKAQTAQAESSALVNQQTAAGIALDNAMKGPRTGNAEFLAELEKLMKDREFQIAGMQLQQANINVHSSQLDLQAKPWFIEIEKRYKEAMTRAEELKIPEAEASAAFWGTVEEWGKGGPVAGKILDTVKDLIISRFRRK